jgi:hypothetical protein
MRTLSFLVDVDMVGSHVRRRISFNSVCSPFLTYISAVSEDLVVSRMSNTEEKKKTTEQEGDDDEPDEWQVAAMLLL